MSPLPSAYRWLRALLSRAGLERELSEELEGHLQFLIEENLRAGLSPAEARRQAALVLGGFQQVKESCRDVRSARFLETLFQDLRYGLRVLRKNPGFTAIAILTLALGTGANSAIFGLLNSALLHGLPFPEPERLVHVWTTEAGGELHTPSPEEYQELRKDSTAFAQIAAAGWADYFYGSDESSWSSLPGFVVTSTWLSTLGVQPLLGRNFRPEEEVAGHDSVVMLSYRCWRNRFHADPSIVGKTISVNRRSVTVVGILPPSLQSYSGDAEVFAPLLLDAYAKTGSPRAGKVRVRIIARLQAGITLDQARSETALVAARLRSPGAPEDGSGRLVVEDFLEGLRHFGPTMQNARRALWLMAAAAGVVLLIACANVASLLLARGVKRQGEVALRAAIGCSRGRLIRQFLTESMLLFVCGGAVGLFVARWCQEIISKTVSGIVPSGAYVEIDGRVFAVSLGVSLLSALFFGMIPAWQATRVNLNDCLKDTASSAAGRLRSVWSRDLLVVFQVALGMVLVVGFALLFRSLLNAESSSLGFDSRNLLTATVRLPVASYADRPARLRLMREAAERVSSMPNVEAAGVTDSLPMDGADSAQFRIEVPSLRVPVQDEIWFLSVSPEYFSTLKVAMLRGRSFSDSDGPASGPVAIVNRTFAKRYFPEDNAIGHHLAFADSPATPREIVGIVSDFRQRNPEEDLRPLVYLPVEQTLPAAWSVVVRVRASPDISSAAQSLGRCLRFADPSLFWELSSIEQHIRDSESLSLRRPIIVLLASFGTLSLLLVAVGVFGVTSYSVTERTREMGIRISLGADRGEILRLVLRETLAIALAGLATGALAALVLTRFFQTGPIGWSGSGIFLYGVSRTDVPSYFGAALFLTTVALAACWLPARRASETDPIVALRSQ